VQNLLSFARQVPPERTLLDINSVISNAVHSVRWTCTRVDRGLRPIWNRCCLGCAATTTSLMQVFFNIVNNGLDAMGDNSGGVLTIKTLRDRGAW